MQKRVSLISNDKCIRIFAINYFMYLLIIGIKMLRKQKKCIALFHKLKYISYHEKDRPNTMEQKPIINSKRRDFFSFIFRQQAHLFHFAFPREKLE